MRWDDLSDTQLVDYVRACIGLAPIPSKKNRPGEQSELPSQNAGIGAYLSAERLLKLADPSCTRCGGSGSYDGWHLDMRCPCTRLPAPRPRPPMNGSPNPSFARRRA